MKRVAKILVVDDEILFAKAVCKRLSRAGYDCARAASLAAAETTLNQQKPDLILLDMRLPDGSGLEFLQRLRAGEHRETAVVVLTAYGELDDAVAAMKQQALDYLKKPVDLDELVATLEHILEPIPGAATAKTRERAESDSQKVQLLGVSTAIQQLKQQGERIATRSTRPGSAAPTVLITGETGTGKDLLARYLHQQSHRAERPFVHVDCASLPKELIEAELFGHEKGAFTHAVSERLGLLEKAAAGTVFLDEIGELSLGLQAKLLAVLERRTLRRVGSSDERRIDAGFIAATNRDLAAMVASGTFRSDLYFRLKILILNMPPLRERDADILLLANHFAERIAVRYGLSSPGFTAAANDALMTYHWPGNVRELINNIERAITLGGDQPISAADLMLDSTPADDDADSNRGALATAEASLIQDAITRAGGNVSEAARLLGVTRMKLRYRMQKYGIER